MTYETTKTWIIVLEGDIYNFDYKLQNDHKYWQYKNDETKYYNKKFFYLKWIILRILLVRKCLDWDVFIMTNNISDFS